MKSVFIRLKQRHPRGFMYLGRHKITNEVQKFELNKTEIESLDTPEVKAWMLVSGKGNVPNLQSLDNVPSTEQLNKDTKEQNSGETKKRRGRPPGSKSKKNRSA